MMVNCTKLNLLAAEDLSEVGMIESFLRENYEVRKNVLSNKFEVRERFSEGSEHTKFRPLSKEAKNSIVTHCRKALGDEVSNPKALVEELVYSEQTPVYDPAREFIESLPLWDGKERVSGLFARIPGMTSDKIYWCSIWMRSMVAHWLNMDTLHGNECVPTLIGPQGCGKSTFCARLLPESLREYYLDHINLTNKNDKEMALTNNLLVNIDEMDQVKRPQQAELKQALSKSKVNGRPIYGREQHDRQRYASFVGTTNNYQPLQDPTGSRRYICILIPENQLIDNESEIDYNQIYAQIKSELEEGKRYWFTNEETKAIQESNLPFQKVSSLDDAVKKCFRHPKQGENVSPLSTTEVMDIVRQYCFSIEPNHANKIRLGKLMSANDYEHKLTMNGSVYYAIPVKL